MVSVANQEKTVKSFFLSYSILEQSEMVGEFDYSLLCNNI